ncbi:hypothetical protein SAMN04487950_0843 [Halogranum rubrum]|uniref:Uncharacterized protein n=1 Tax=Halogranum rubrum TaxID=553466 RepID=A0A1I4C0L4_9EURY|nr:hypothetical protein SAMN04487950_0843 [Halogranum rubrum]
MTTTGQFLWNIASSLLPLIGVHLVPVYFFARYTRRGRPTDLKFAVYGTISTHLFLLLSTPVVSNAVNAWYLWDFLPGQSRFADYVYDQLFVLVPLFVILAYGLSREKPVLLVCWSVLFGLIAAFAPMEFWYWYLFPIELGAVLYYVSRTWSSGKPIEEQTV